MKNIKKGKLILMMIVMFAQSLVPVLTYADASQSLGMQKGILHNQIGNVELEYDGKRLIHTQTANFETRYLWHNDSLIGFVFKGENYYYIKNELTSMITGIADADAHTICEYNYDIYGVVEHVTNYAGDRGKELIAANGMVNIGAFYDEETGRYWYNGYEYDPYTYSFVQSGIGVLSADSINGIEQYGFQAIQYYNARVNSSNYQKKIAYSMTWYDQTLDDIDLITRLIYGEMGYSVSGEDWDYEQRKAIAWVLFNRMQYSAERFPNTLRDVCIQTGEFSAITGNTDDTAGARYANGSVANVESWKEALLTACYLYVSSTETIMTALIKAPVDYNDQLFFCSYNTYMAMEAISLSKIDKASVSLTVGGVAENESKKNVFFNYKDI